MSLAENQTTTIEGRSYAVRFPQRDEQGISQDAEWCEIMEAGRVRRIRFHDYADIYTRPGLYEQLFSTELECCSPATVAELLAGELGRLDGAPLRILDVGAGNGMVGEELRGIGAAHVVGCDILPEAAAAAERDRPGVYDDYVVGDLTALGDADVRRLRDGDFNALSLVAALGFGDIPTAAFVAAFDHVADGGLIAFNIKDEFVGDNDESGFAQLVKRAVADGTMEIVARHEYTHRLSVTGEPLDYVAFVAVKHAALG